MSQPYPRRQIGDIRGLRFAHVFVFTNTVTHEWNHALGEIVTAVLDAGLELTMLEEHDSVPWEALPGHMTEVAENEWRVSDRPCRLPHTYTLQPVYRPG